MDVKVKKGGSATAGAQENEMGIRKGPWTLDEDTILIDYVTNHGEDHWNSVARSAGLRRSGKSCRLRWLNYLRPDVRRGNITLQEQILILDLHSRWGNRWSKIAQHLPGRTDNEIKNYWRTRVMKQAKQLKCDVNSKQFRDALRYVWMPRLLERVQLAPQSRDPNPNRPGSLLHQNGSLHGSDSGLGTGSCPSGTSSDSSSADFQLVPSISGHVDSSSELLLGHDVSAHKSPSDLWPGNQMLEQGNGGGGDSLESLWNDESMWFLQQLSDDLEIKYNFLA